MAPNHIEVIGLRGFLLRRLGRMDEAADALYRTWQMEPNSGGFSREAMATLIRADRCDQANEVRRDALARRPDNNGILDLSSWVELTCNRNVDKAIELIRRVKPTTLVETEAKFLTLLLGDKEEALQLLIGLDESFLVDPVAEMIFSGYQTWLYREMGDPGSATTALKNAEEAAAQIEEISYGIQARRAFLAALAGNEQAAREYGEMALADVPVDAIIEVGTRYQVAVAWTLAGLVDEALEQLEILQSQTSKADFALSEIDPSLSSLHEMDRFERLFEAGAGH
jgi:tetratricopeptide (TPR) repeat protein